MGFDGLYPENPLIEPVSMDSIFMMEHYLIDILWHKGPFYHPFIFIIIFLGNFFFFFHGLFVWPILYPPNLFDNYCFRLVTLISRFTGLCTNRFQPLPIYQRDTTKQLFELWHKVRDGTLSR